MEAFEWFTLENKVRTLVLELIEPTTHKSEEQKYLEDKMEDSIKSHRLRLEEVELTLDRLTRKTSVIEAFSKRLTALETNQKVVETKMKQEISAVQSQIDVFNHQSIVVTASLRSFDSQLETFMQAARIYSDEVESLKENLLAKLQQLKTNFSEEISHCQVTTKACEDAVLAAKRDFDSLHSSIVGIDVKVMSCQQQIKFLDHDVQGTIKHPQFKLNPSRSQSPSSQQTRSKDCEEVKGLSTAVGLLSATTSPQVTGSPGTTLRK